MKIGQPVSYYNSQGDEKAAIVCAIHKDGTVDLCILTANTRRVECRVWKEPGTCQVVPEAEDQPVGFIPSGPYRPESSSPVMPWGTGPRPADWDAPPMKVPEGTTLTSVPVEAMETTTAEVPDGGP